MLAEKVTANIFGILSEKSNLYTGHINIDTAKNVSVYIVSRKKPKDSFAGTIIAVVTLEDGTEKPVVAPDGDIFYEPELLEILSRLKNVTITSIKCLYEKSCGAIIFYKGRQNNINLLLVKNSNGRYWSFPKGHIEQGETEHETAKREIKEETGLDVEICGNFREISEYCPFGKIRKRVVFFLARAFTDNVVIQESEIDSYIWVDLQQARKLCSYDNDLRIIDKAETAIHLMK